MRPQTQKRIDALHAEIDRLVKMEKAWANRAEPEPNEFLREVRDNAIDVAAWSPTMRATSHWATATFPVLGDHAKGDGA